MVETRLYDAYNIGSTLPDTTLQCIYYFSASASAALTTIPLI